MSVCDGVMFTPMSLGNDFHHLLEEAARLRDGDPQAALPVYQQAREVARKAGDHVMVLQVDYYIVQTHLYDLRDYGAAVELAVKAALESRKSLYDGQQIRFFTHDNLVCSYLYIDPIGYSEMIEQAFVIMDEEMPPLPDCVAGVQWDKAKFALACERWDQAGKETRLALALAENQPHHFGNALVLRAHYCFIRQEWHNLLNATLMGQMFLLGAHYAPLLAELLAGQALAQRQLGREAEALTAYRLATMRAGTTRRGLDAPYYDLLCAFHEAVGDADAGLRVRQGQLNDIAGKGQLYWEARAQVDFIRRLKQTGQPYASAIAPARTLIHKLRKPDALLRQLDEITRDDRA